MASTSSGRAAFIQWCVSFVTKYGISGINIDWEYPGSAGAGCNIHSSSDVTNLLALVTELRSAFDKNFASNKKEITLAVHITPWGGGKFNHKKKKTKHLLK
jgi:chitinase